MKVKDLLNAIKDCDPEMDVFADVHDGLLEITNAEVSKWYNEENFDKFVNAEDENIEFEEETAFCLKVACPLPVYMP